MKYVVMKSSFLFVRLLAVLIGSIVLCQQGTAQNTWTYTYLKAKEGQKENLKSFLKKN